MDDDDRQEVMRYHEATKHHPHRYARSLGYLDWSTQPDPFRRFTGSSLYQLGTPEESTGPPYEELFAAGGIAPWALDMRSVSRFLHLSLALSAWKEAGGHRWALRCNPSSGNLHPTEGYLVLPGMPGLDDLPGVYHYAAAEHGLERRCSWERRSWQALQGDTSLLFLVGLSSVLWREAWKYGERAFRYCELDIGHALGALRFAAAALGWSLVVLEEFDDRHTAHLLGLDRDEDFNSAEREEPALLAAVAAPGPPLRLDARWTGDLRIVRWEGRANRLSPRHVHWEAIDAVVSATRKEAPHRGPGPEEASVREAPPPAPHARTPRSALQVIRGRRSALAFDGQTRVSAGHFCSMLARLLPGAATADAAAAAMPWDSIPWAPCIDLLLFVHRVEDLAPGLYLLTRDLRRPERLRPAMRPELTWRRPPGAPGLPTFYQLMAGDLQDLAARLSLGQSIAGTCAFSLAMIAEFERPLVERGAWFYRRLYREAGLIGQVLYLEAEAARMRGTGIGAYFDDLVHELCGLRGHAFQDLYHFAVGGPVEDRRLVTGS